MPSAREVTLARIDRLITKGQTVFDSGTGASYHVDQGLSAGFEVQARVLLRDVVGDESDYYQRFCQLEEDDDDYPNQNRTSAELETLRSLREDIEHGHLRRLRTLVSAEVFGDFLEMAGHLLESGYKDAAASLIGAVLENGLKQIASDVGVAVKPRDDLSAVNNKLAAKSIYTRLVQKSVAVWADIRNHADHGQFGEYSEADVAGMLDGSRRFLGERLS